MIGLIFGETNFPKEILHQIKKDKIKYLIIDLTKEKNFRFNKNSHHVSIGQIGKIINILKKNKCKKIIFAGKVKKPNFLKIKIDFKGVCCLPKIIKAAKIGDAAILKEVINIFKKEKINTLSSLFFTPELSLKKGIQTKIKPDNNDKKDIEKAITVLSKLNSYNYSQATVVQNRKVLMIEGSSGTEKMLSKIKKKQDLRIDLPTIGLKTLLQCKKAGLKGIVLKNKQNVCLDKKILLRSANKNKMFILVK